MSLTGKTSRKPKSQQAWLIRCEMKFVKFGRLKFLLAVCCPADIKLFMKCSLGSPLVIYNYDNKRFYKRQRKQKTGGWIQHESNWYLHNKPINLISVDIFIPEN